MELKSRSPQKRATGLERTSLSSGEGPAGPGLRQLALVSQMSRDGAGSVGAGKNPNRVWLLLRERTYFRDKGGVEGVGTGNRR